MEFFERHRYPDVSLECVKDGKTRHIYGFDVALYELHDYEVGRDHNTIYMQRDKVYTGASQLTVVFADENDNITSVGTHQWGDIEKEYGCGEHSDNNPMNALNDLEDRPITPRVWRALSMDEASESTHAYESALHKDEEQAKAEALQKCRAAGGKNCVSYQWFSNVCISTATGNKGGSSLAYIGSSLEAADADAMALKECGKFATDCKIFRNASCAVPCDVVKDKQCMYEQPRFGLYGTTNGKAIPWGLTL